MNLSDFVPTKARTPNVSALMESEGKVVQDRRTAYTEKALGAVFQTAGKYLEKFQQAEQDAKYNTATNNTVYSLNEMVGNRLAMKTDENGNPNYESLMTDVNKIVDLVKKENKVGLKGKTLRKYEQDVAKLKNQFAFKSFAEMTKQRGDYLLNSLKENVAKKTTLATQNPEKEAEYMNEISGMYTDAVKQGLVSTKDAHKAMQDLTQEMRLQSLIGSANKDPEQTQKLLLNLTPEQLGLSLEQYNKLYSFNNKRMAEIKEKANIQERERKRLEKTTLEANYQEINLSIIKDPRKVSILDIMKAESTGKITKSQSFRLQGASIRGLRKVGDDLSKLESANMHTNYSAQKLETELLLKNRKDGFEDETLRKPNDQESLEMLTDIAKNQPYANNYYANELGKMLEFVTENGLCNTIMKSFEKMQNECPNGTLGHLNDKQKLIGNMAYTYYTVGGKNAKQALETARQVYSNLDPTTITRNSARLAEKEIKEQFDAGNLEKMVKKEFLGYGDNWFVNINMSDLNLLGGVLQNNFKLTGDMETSKRMLVQFMQKTYGVDKIEGRNVLMAYPPSKNLTLPKNTSIGKDFKMFAKRILGDLNEEDKGDPLSLASDIQTSQAIAEKEFVDYQVLIKRGDIYVPLINKHGNLVRYPYPEKPKGGKEWWFTETK